MKKQILVAIFIATRLFIAIHLFAQMGNNLDGRYTAQNLDINGALLKNTSVQLNVPYANSTIVTVYDYDSIRSLSEINDPNYADAYPWISPDGLRLYYTSGANFNGLMFTQRADTNSFFITPTLVPILVSDALSYWLSTDELDVYISTRYNIKFAHRDSVSLPFNTPVTINLLGISGAPFLSGASLNEPQDELFMYYNNSPQDEGIIEFSRLSGTSFTYTRTLPHPAGYSMTVGQLSKDELTFFFGAAYNNGKTSLYQMTRVTPADSFEINTFQEIKGINDTTVLNIQPSMSDNLNWVTFVRNPVYIWESNDLFLAHKGIVSSVFNPDEMQITSSVFPNPASEYVSVKCRPFSQDPLLINVFSSAGNIIYQNDGSRFAENFMIETRSMKDGLYFYRVLQFTNGKPRVGTGKFVVLH
jgi:hypothetical protein